MWLFALRFLDLALLLVFLFCQCRLFFLFAVCSFLLQIVRRKMLYHMRVTSLLFLRSAALWLYIGCNSIFCSAFLSRCLLAFVVLCIHTFLFPSFFACFYYMCVGTFLADIGKIYFSFCFGGEDGIRTHDTFCNVYQFSRLTPSTTRPPLLLHSDFITFQKIIQ